MCTSQGRRSWFLTPCGIGVRCGALRGSGAGGRARRALYISPHSRTRSRRAPRRTPQARARAQHGARTRRAPRRMCARATATPHARARETETRGERTRPLGRGASTSPPAQQEPAIACTCARALSRRSRGPWTRKLGSQQVHTTCRARLHIYRIGECQGFHFSLTLHICIRCRL